MVWFGVVCLMWLGLVKLGLVWFGLVWFCLVWLGMVWHPWCSAQVPFLARTLFGFTDSQGTPGCPRERLSTNLFNVSSPCCLTLIWDVWTTQFFPSVIYLNPKVVQLFLSLFTISFSLLYIMFASSASFVIFSYCAWHNFLWEKHTNVISGC